MTKKQLIELICDLLDIESINHMIKTQITKFTTQYGYTYKEIGRAVYFFVTVKKNTPNLDYGIGIVPKVMTAAQKIFKH